MSLSCCFVVSNLSWRELDGWNFLILIQWDDVCAGVEHDVKVVGGKVELSAIVSYLAIGEGVDLSFLKHLKILVTGLIKEYSIDFIRISIKE